MKSSLNHLPEFRRALLQEITAIYRASGVVEILILYGSHARDGHERRSAYRSDVDLLAVVADEATANDDALWLDLDERVGRRARPLTVETIAHDIYDVNHQIRSGHYFFVDIVQEGVLLYNSGRFRLSAPGKADSPQQLELALLNFREWFEQTGQFWRGMNYFYFLRDIRTSMFMLHQSAERAYHSALLVFTAYKPKTHDLVDLAAKTESLHPRLANALPRATRQDAELLKLLSRAYVDARYAIDYKVTMEQLSILRERVHVLLQRVSEASREEIDEIADGKPIGELPGVPRLDDMAGAPPMPDGFSAEARSWAADFVSYEKARMEAREQESRKLGRLEGLRAGREEGLQEGEARGIEIGRRRGHELGVAEGRLRAQAEALVDVLLHRTIHLTEAERDAILTCRSDTELRRLRDKVWTIGAASELWP